MRSAIKDFTLQMNEPCYNCFQHKGALNNHMTSTAHDIHGCEFCGAEFKWTKFKSALKRLEQHQLTCSKPKKKQPRRQPANAPQYPCHGNSCPEVFTSKRNLLAHEAHCDDVVFRCDICGGTLDSRRLLGVHKKKCWAECFQGS